MLARRSGYIRVDFANNRVDCAHNRAGCISTPAPKKVFHIFFNFIKTAIRCKAPV
jgi:hypothetical protein